MAKISAVTSRELPMGIYIVLPAFCMNMSPGTSFAFAAFLSKAKMNATTIK